MLRINDTAPDFSADTTQGKIRFHDWIGDSWAVLFSHPKDFTPVCTTELGYMAKIEPEFRKRNAKIIGIFVRLCVRDGKPQYLHYLPRVCGHFLRDLEHPLLEPVRAFVARTVPKDRRTTVKIDPAIGGIAP